MTDPSLDPSGNPWATTANGTPHMRGSDPLHWIDEWTESLAETLDESFRPHDSTDGSLITPEAIGAAPAVHTHHPTWEPWTPTWFNAGNPPGPIGVGNGMLSGRYLHVGRYVTFDLLLTRASNSGQGVDQWAFTLPVQPLISRRVAASGSIYSRGSYSPVFGYGVYSGATFGHAIGMTDAAGAAIRWESRTWQSGDSLYISGFYEAVEGPA